MVKSMQMVFCACGCGQLRPMYDNRGRRGHYIFNHHGIDTRFEKGHSPWCKGKYLVNPNLTMSGDLAYILGVYYSDGYISYHTGSWLIGLHVKEKAFAEYFRETMLRIGLHPSSIYKSNEISRVNKIKTTYYRTTAYSNKLCNFIKSLDIFSLPDILTEKETLALCFLRGCFESEGSARNRKGHGVEIMVFCNTNVNLINVVCKLLKWLDYSFSITKEEHDEEEWNTLYRVNLHGDSKIKKKFLYQLNPIIKKVI